MDEKKGIAKIAKYFVNFQYGLSIVMALLLLAMIGYEVVMRYVFKSSLMGVEEVMVFPIIWLYMLGGANASYEKSHIECGILTLYIKKEHSMLIFNLVKRIICVVILAWITYWSSGMFLGSADVLKCIWKCIHENNACVGVLPVNRNRSSCQPAIYSSRNVYGRQWYSQAASGLCGFIYRTYQIRTWNSSNCCMRSYGSDFW